MKGCLSRSTITFLCLFFTLVFVASGYPQGSELAKYPNRPVNFILPYSAGGTVDVACRLLLRGAEKHLGQPIVVINKPGGGGATGVGAIATAKPDGYTFGFTSGAGTLFIVPLMEKLPYHPIKDIKYIMQFGEIHYGVAVKADSSFKNFKDLVSYARENPKKLTYGTNAPFSVSNLVMQEIAKKEKVQFTHIPFKASPEIQTALLGGHILVSVGDFNYTLIEAGDMRLLMLLAEKRPEFYPQVPILKELGYNLPAPAISTIGGPKGLPEEIVKTLEQALRKAMQEPEFIKGMKDLRFTVVYRNSKDLEDFVGHTFEASGKLLKETGFIK